MSASRVCSSCEWWDRDLQLEGETPPRMGNCFCMPRVERKREDQRCRWFEAKESAA